MTATSRWIRLDVDWTDSPWLCALDSGARYCWIEMLCYVKRSGVRGRVKALHPTVAAKRWDVAVAEVERMIQAALDDEALAEDGDDWVVVSWKAYQPDQRAAERMRRYRDTQGRRQNRDSLPRCCRAHTAG